MVNVTDQGVKPLGVALSAYSGYPLAKIEKISLIKDGEKSNAGYIEAGLFVSFANVSNVTGLVLHNVDKPTEGYHIVGITGPEYHITTESQIINGGGIYTSYWVQVDPENLVTPGMPAFVDNKGRLTSVNTMTPVSLTVLKSSASGLSCDSYTGNTHTGWALITNFLPVA